MNKEQDTATTHHTARFSAKTERGAGAAFRQPAKDRRLDIQKQIAAIRKDLGQPENAQRDARLAAFEAQQI